MEDIFDVGKNVLDVMLENEISEYAKFYIKYLQRYRSKSVVITNEIDNLLKPLHELIQSPALYISEDHRNVLAQIDNFLKKYWDQELLLELEAKLNYKSAWWPSKNENFLKDIGNIILASLDEADNKRKRLYQFLVYIKECFKDFGLHSSILKRNAAKSKQFNILIVYKKGRQEFKEARVLMSEEILQTEYLTPYSNGQKLFINGIIVTCEKIFGIKISSTFLASEIEYQLFAYKNGFLWDTSTNRDIHFCEKCCDESNNYTKQLRPPSLIFKNGSTQYVSQSRINELQKLKSKKFDTSRLVGLCTEINQSSKDGLPHAVISLLRTILNFIPTIFGYNDFKQVVASHPFSKSVQKTMDRLLHSTKNIADSNLHAQAKTVDALPNMTQVDFSNDLDVLLAEVIKQLKSTS